MADQYTVQVRIAGTNALSAPVGQATQSLRGLTQEAGRTNAAMNQLKTIGMGLFAGVSAAGVVRMAEDLYQTGMAAQRAGNLFRSFGAQIGDTDAVLARMRETTRGVVKDVDLMNAANSMLSMGLAKNAEDVQRLTDIGVTFAQAMGQDVGASLENLNMILANQSYLRLDTLGISSSQVRELAAQYRAAGMDSSEAFTAAFLEVAEGKLPQMAAVADATVTELQKLQTSMDNWWADFGNRFAQGVNGLIGIATYGGLAIQAALFGNESVWAGNTAAGNPQWASMAGALTGATRSPTDTNWTPQQIAAVIGLAQNRGVSVESLGIGDLRMVSGQPAGFDSQYLQLQAEAIETLRQIAQANEWAAAYNQTMQQIAEQSATPGGGFSVVPGGMVDPMVEQRNLMLGGANNWLQAIRGERGQYGGSFMAGSSAQEIRMAADEVQRMVDEAMRLDEINPDFLSDNNVQMLSDMANEASRTADQAERMAQAFESASLSQLFGQTSGGRLGEIDAAVLGAMQAGGASDATMEAMRTALGMNSGQLTDLSVQFERDVVPMLADIGAQFGADALIAARTAYEQAIQDAALTGQTGPVDLAAVLGYAYTMPGTGGGGSFTVNPGDTPGAVAARTGMTVDQVLAATGAANAYSMPVGTFGSPGGDLVQITQDAADNVAEAADNATGITDEMTTAVDTLATGIEGVFSRTYQLPIELVVSGGGVLAQLIAAAVQGNGGTTPGQSVFTGKSGSSGKAGGFGKG